MINKVQYLFYEMFVKDLICIIYLLHWNEGNFSFDKKNLFEMVRIK